MPTSKNRYTTSRAIMLIRLAAVFLIAAATACNGKRVQVPDSGVARTADGHVAFIQPTPGRLVATSLADEEATELWYADRDGRHARRLAAGRASDTVERALASFEDPRFSPDGRKVYFLSRAWVTSEAVHVVDIATGRESFVAPGNSLEIISRGPFAGCLLVEQHRYWPNEGDSYDWTWLIDSHGREIALAASDSDGAEHRLAIWSGGAVPASARLALPPAPSNEGCN
jgi:Tol biopolymer transport system component